MYKRNLQKMYIASACCNGDVALIKRKIISISNETDKKSVIGYD